MFVIGRKNKESAVITVMPTDHPVQIQVVVSGIERDKVKLGFLTDEDREDVVIDRFEVHQRKLAEVEEAALLLDPHFCSKCGFTPCACAL